MPNETPEPGSLAARLPADFTPEAKSRLLEISTMAEAVARRLVRGKQESDEPAAVFDLHTRPRSESGLWSV